MAKRAEGGKRIIEAALATWKEEGYAQASARAIAGAGGFNQGLIYYHFDDLDDLFLEALDLTSRRRLERYRESVDGCRTATDLVAALKLLYAEDVAPGHVAALQQLAAVAAPLPPPGPAGIRAQAPWANSSDE